MNEKSLEYISKEIELTYSQIDKQRESTTEFFKIYLSIILGLFAYIYFLENRLIIDGKRIELPTNDYLVFGIFGLILCLIAFIIGWALLDNVTKSVYKSIKHYKHISYMRNLINQIIGDNLLLNNSVLPLKQSNIPMRISAQVPLAGGLINLGLLLLNYYFFYLFISKEYALLATTLIISILSVFYSNLLEKHFEEILIAQKLEPERDEMKLKNQVKVLVRQKKRSKNYRYTKTIYFASLIVLIISIIINVVNIEGEFVSIKWKDYLIWLPIVIFLISIIPRVFMGRHRIKYIQCFE